MLTLIINEIKLDGILTDIYLKEELFTHEV